MDLAFNETPDLQPRKRGTKSLCDLRSCVWHSGQHTFLASRYLRQPNDREIRHCGEDAVEKLPTATIMPIARCHPNPLLLRVKPTGKSLPRKDFVQRVTGLEVIPSTEGHGRHGVASSVTPAV